MTVFIELAILNNLCIDALIIVLSMYALRQAICPIRCVASSIIGTIFAIALPLLEISQPILVIIKLLIGCLMVLTMCKHQSLSHFFKSLTAFFVSTAIVGGVCYAIVNIVGSDFTAEAIGLILLGAVICGILFIRFVTFFQMAQIFKSFCYDISMRIGDRHVGFKGYLDTGNLLRDPLTNSPIIVLSASALYRNAQDCISSTQLFGMRTISYNTVSGASKLKIFKTKQLKIYFKDKVNILYDVMVGISYSELSCHAQYDVLLNPALM